MSKLRAYWDSRSLFGKIAMAIALPIFAIVAGAEHLIARMTGATYNEVNIIVYYLVIPLSWTLMLDYITRMPFLTPMFMDYLYLERQNELQKSMRLGIQKIRRFSTMVQEDWLELCRQFRHYLCCNTHSCLHRTNICHHQLKLGSNMKRIIYVVILTAL